MIHYEDKSTTTVSKFSKLFMLLLRTKWRRVIYFLLIITSWYILSKLLAKSHHQLNDEYINMIDDSGVRQEQYLSEWHEYNKLKQDRKFQSDKFNNIIKNVDPNTRNKISLNKGHYLILEYTKVFKDTKFCQNYEINNRNYYKKNNLYVPGCKYTNCIFTCDKSLFNDADALIYHYADLHRELNTRFYSSVLTKRNVDQIWILWNDEPMALDKITDKLNFNWTMSYRVDSEISDCAYGCKYKLNNDDQSRREEVQYKINNEFKKRKSSSVWFVSNCKSKLRIEFAVQLSEYFPVEVAGLCAPVLNLMKKLSVSADSIINKIAYFSYWALNTLFGLYDCKRNSICEMNHVLNNKFYLSLESTNCSDYITEKFWRILRFGMIPIVIQPSKLFYKEIAPSNSYIHFEDFNFDIKKLADHLHKVSNDITLYSKYFMWRSEYDVVYSAKQSESRRLCELCTRLNEETSTIYYSSVSKWFNNYCNVN